MNWPSPRNEGSRLESIRSFRILGTSCEQEFDDIAHLAALMCDTPVAVIAFVDERRVWFKAKIGLEVDEIPRDDSFCAHAILQSDVLIVPDSISDQRFMSGFLVKQNGIRYYAGISLITVDNHALGTLAVMDRVPHLMTAEQIDSLQTLARRIVGELERRRTTDAQSPHQRLHLEPPHPRSVNILMVEDNDNLRNLLQRTLEGVGFSVFPASDGAEALRLERPTSGHDRDCGEVILSCPNSTGLSFPSEFVVARPETKFLFITGFEEQFPRVA